MVMKTSKFTKRRIVSFIMMCLLLVGTTFTGCTYGFPEGFDKEEVIAEAEAVINVISAQDYEGLVAIIREDLRSNVTAKDFEDSCGEALDELGKFEKFGNPVLSGEMDTETGEEFALVAYRCYYEKGKATYTVYFDSNMEVTAVYMQLN